MSYKLKLRRLLLCSSFVVSAWRFWGWLEGSEGRAWNLEKTEWPNDQIDRRQVKANLVIWSLENIIPSLSQNHHTPSQLTKWPKRQNNKWHITAFSWEAKNSEKFLIWPNDQIDRKTNTATLNFCRFGHLVNGLVAVRPRVYSSPIPKKHTPSQLTNWPNRQKD